MKNKIGKDIFNKIQNTLTIDNTEIIESYNPKINYNEFDLKEEEKEKLIDCEKNALKNAKQITQNLKNLGEAFSLAQKIFSVKRDGSFKQWYEGLNFKKDFVYMCLKRYELYYSLENDKIFSITEKKLKLISKVKDVLQKEDLNKIINSEKEIENTKKTPIVEMDPVRIKKEIKKYKNKIKELEAQLKIALGK
ncbi:hypothetical protein [Cetobacterium ceti]